MGWVTLDDGQRVLIGPGGKLLATRADQLGGRGQGAGQGAGGAEQGGDRQGSREGEEIERSGHARTRADLT